LALASARAGCRMGRQLPRSRTALARIIRPVAPEVAFGKLSLRLAEFLPGNIESCLAGSNDRSAVRWRQ
jgi:hypothetical protein